MFAAFYKLTDTRAQITAYVFDVVRSTVPKLNLDEVFTSKVEIAQDVKEELVRPQRRARRMLAPSCTR